MSRGNAKLQSSMGHGPPDHCMDPPMIVLSKLSFPGRLMNVNCQDLEILTHVWSSEWCLPVIATSRYSYFLFPL